MNREASERRAAELRRIIEHHNRRYYQDDAPELPDSEYDRLLRELMDLEERFPELAVPDSPTRRVGAPPLEKFTPFPHRTPMLSLSNAFADEEVSAFDRRIRERLGTAAVDYTAEPKFDGLAVSLAYEDTMRGIRPCMDAYGHILRRPHIARRLGLTPRLGDPVLFNNNLTSGLARLLKREHGFDFATRAARVDGWSAS